MTDTQDALSITVNGERKTLPGGATVADLLRAMDLDPDEARGIAVAVGDDVIRKEAWSATRLRDEAQVEVITAQQGG